MHAFPSWLPRRLRRWLDAREAFWHAMNRSNNEFWEKLNEPLEALISYDPNDDEQRHAMWDYRRGVRKAIEQRLGHPVMPWWKEGAIWVHHVGPHRSNLHIEWQVPSRHQGISFEMDGVWEGELKFHLGIWLAGVWIALEDVKGLPRKERELSLRWHHQSLWWSLWIDDSDTRNYAKWRGRCWHPLDTLLGKQQYSKRDIGTIRTEVELPEGRMPVLVKFTTATWKRPRWPTVQTVRRADMTPDVPTPVPGKGENSYDLDDDAICEMTTRAATLPEALEHYRKSVLWDRKKYGGSEAWQPTGGGL